MPYFHEPHISQLFMVNVQTLGHLIKDNCVFLLIKYLNNEIDIFYFFPDFVLPINVIINSAMVLTK